MLTVMCPNCRHRFPAPGCCNSGASVAMSTSTDQFSSCGGGAEYLVPRGYLNAGGAIIHALGHQDSDHNRKGGRDRISSHCQIATTRDLTGGTVTLTKRDPVIGGQTPNLQQGIFQNPHPKLFPPPSGCQELPGMRRNSENTFDFKVPTSGKEHLDVSSPGCGSSSFFKTFDVTQGSHPASGTLIQVNATLQLPPNVAHCTVSITASANTVPTSSGLGRNRNNFNGGGIVEAEAFGNVCERDDNSPTTPVSWVLPFPWGINGRNTGNGSSDFERLSAAQRVLQASGWYHEGLSWQQSAALLKDSPVGSWLMRDSSDERFMYAVSVQTARGPTAVRVHYVCGRFRLDAEPKMAPLMPMFECPVKMIEHYIEYSKKMERQKEVWVDHSGQLYSQIYLTKPLLKEVGSLSHLARLAVNRSNISTKELPAPLREYIAEYRYTV